MLGISLQLTLFVSFYFCFASFIKNDASVSQSKARRKYVILSMVSQIPSNISLRRCFTSMHGSKKQKIGKKSQPNTRNLLFNTFAKLFPDLDHVKILLSLQFVYAR